jgi:hypothetical protein
VQNIYMDNICTLTIQPPAKLVLQAFPEDPHKGHLQYPAPPPNGGAMPMHVIFIPDFDIVMASASFGRGLVFAVGSPWLINRNIDIQSPQSQIDNRKAAENLARWLLSAASK